MGSSTVEYFDKLLLRQEVTEFRQAQLPLAEVLNKLFFLSGLGHIIYNRYKFLTLIFILKKYFYICI